MPVTRCLVLSIAVIAALAGEAVATTRKLCLAGIKTELDRLGAEIKELEKKAIIYTGRPNPTDPGPCTKLIGRLQGSFYVAARVNPAQAAHWNEISCLELDRIYLRQKCRCAEFQFEVSRDTSVITRFLDVRKRYDDLAALVRKKGIRDDAIRQWVQGASRARDCWHEKTAALFNHSINLMDAALKQP